MNEALTADAAALAFQWPVRVYWEDTDAGGVVYHAQYLAFMERARSEWMRAIGHGQELLRDRDGLVFVVRAMQVDFRSPARLDDALLVSVELRECRRASLLLRQEIRRDGALLVDGEVRIAALAASTFRPCALPPLLFEQLKSHEHKGD
ncbi:tol-pal system-associated acyl-CoA thioesterase [Solilutibacter silvestris]|uniref:Tol-pal system-associated acyl-CoA thioesterase n=1 Tax=Solilutibacter silvestris TaxID=1645665 RepID=A0A2K1Q2T7_9GAMM|nr:tol-pal system-associated acyl-CoA thioesterase [Lysobacter silvestris]PNS09352.1 tol-pal system-associated acyl-CoA thioesterase [Lysobacter silvestris]